MLKAYTDHNRRLMEVSLTETPPTSPIVWIDLVNPTPDEEKQVENLLEVDIPTRDEIREIEISNTLYQENGSIYTTAILITQSDTPEPETHPVSFILSGNTLVTVRYAEPKAFNLFISKCQFTVADYSSGARVLAELLDTIVGRAADSIEKAARVIEDTTKAIFISSALPTPSGDMPKADFQSILISIGHIGNLVSKIGEALVSLSRVTSYVMQTPYYQTPADIQHMDTILKDIIALRDHDNALSHKVGFLLDATLGMISIEQNAIIKIFSVAAVIFLPPTLIASIYGMNFQLMPELTWHLGYPLALGAMVISAYLPFRFFKRKGWL